MKLWSCYQPLFITPFLTPSEEMPALFRSRGQHIFPQHLLSTLFPPCRSISKETGGVAVRHSWRRGSSYFFQVTLIPVNNAATAPVIQLVRERTRLFFFILYIGSSRKFLGIFKIFIDFIYSNPRLSDVSRCKIIYIITPYQ